MQRLRGRVYAGDQAIDRADLTADGRHKLSVDEDSWHVLSLDQQGEVVACLRYVDESNARGFDDLWVRHAAVARCPRLGWKFREAVELALQRTRQAAIRFGEVGGWAVAEEHRGTTEPLRIILATYGLLELMGSCAGVATATFRHSSARILQKIGLTALTVDGQELPPYQDAQYGCQMQALQFDSRAPNSRFRSWIAELSRELAAAPVVCPASIATTLDRVWHGFDLPAPALAPA
ncbi:MAG TPA: hypothetical protein VME43_01275 [Bryobacteraceae bacterium]|nr:hypothetical protein [Bryobacteraceae bacterium]